MTGRMNAHLGNYDYAASHSGKSGNEITKIGNLANASIRVGQIIEDFEGNLADAMVDFGEAPAVYNLPASKQARRLGL